MVPDRDYRGSREVPVAPGLYQNSDYRNSGSAWEHQEGAVLGLAVGDALGATYEFCQPDAVPDGPLEIVGGGWLDLAPGETTDDTALAECVIEGYGPPVGSYDAGVTRAAMIRWLESGPKDVGNQTRRALLYLRDNPQAARLPDDAAAQGNGAVMRAAAHGVAAPSPERASRNAYGEAALTHPSFEARVTAALVAALVGVLTLGRSETAEMPETPRASFREDPGAALRASYLIVQESLPQESLPQEALSGLDPAWLARRIPPLDTFVYDPGGWTVYTTRLALRTFLDAPDFRTGVERVVRLGGDADTNAAVTGALLGARFGSAAIPVGWLKSLEDAGRLSTLLAATQQALPRESGSLGAERTP